MDENPYSAPEASTAVENQAEHISLRTAAIRGAKIGALTGMAIIGIPFRTFSGRDVGLWRVSRKTHGRGFRLAIDKMTDGKSLWEMVGSGVAGLAVFAAWGGIIGAIAKTLSEWSRR